MERFSKTTVAYGDTGVRSDDVMQNFFGEAAVTFPSRGHAGGLGRADDPITGG
jgi:hypothetical protein